MLELYNLINSIFRKRLNTQEIKNKWISSIKSQEPDIVHMTKKIVNERQKMDDVSDCVIQAQAYKFRNYIAKF